MASWSMATTEKWTDKNSGEAKEQTEWHRCVLWGKSAESLADYLLKGKQIYCEGKLQTRQWEDKDGNKRYTTEVKVDRVTLLGGGGARRRDADEERDEPLPDPVAAAAALPERELADDDIPFVMLLPLLISMAGVLV